MLKLDITPEQAEIISASIARNLTKEWTLECLQEVYEAGMSDEDLRSCLPRTFRAYNPREPEALKKHSAQMVDKMLAVLTDCRDAGFLHPVPNGVDRGIRVAKAWNDFVAGREIEPHNHHWLLDAPLPEMINRAFGSGFFRRFVDLRTSRGFDDHPAINEKDRTGAAAAMPIEPADLEIAAEASALAVEASVIEPDPFALVSIGSITCPKTDNYLTWKLGAVLQPVLGFWKYLPDNVTLFEEVEPFETVSPLRHIEIKAPSGRIFMADWFRIPGFNEGVADRDEVGPSINSELGVDERTRDHYERLGLMRIHTTNCMPDVLQDGNAFRVGHFDEYHDDLWEDNPDVPGEHQKTSGFPEVVGQVCCDMWDVTFADREILIDILVAGGKEIEENDGLGERDSIVKGYARTREEAAEMLDKYASEETFVAEINVEPGSPLHVYMATGHGAEDFSENFSTESLADRDYMNDLFVLSETELVTDPDMVEEADWVWPDRYQPDTEAALSPGL